MQSVVGMTVGSCCWLAQDRTEWLGGGTWTQEHFTQFCPWILIEGTIVLANVSFPLLRKTVCLSHFLPQAQLLKELEHRVTQEALHRQQLDLMKASSMEKLLKDVQQKEQDLQLLTEDAKRASKVGQLQRKKIQTELRQVTPVRGSKSGCTSQSGFHLVLSTPLLPPQRCSLPWSLPGTAGKWKYLYLGDC